MEHKSLCPFSQVVICLQVHTCCQRDYFNSHWCDWIVALCHFMCLFNNWETEACICTLFVWSHFNSGFRSRSGTPTALVSLMNGVCQEKNMGGTATLFILVGHLVAWNTSNQIILLDRVSGMLHSCESTSILKAISGKWCQELITLPNGRRPMSSILSSVLFNTYVKLLNDIIWRFGMRRWQYEDDI